jgi:hypothetical protein
MSIKTNFTYKNPLCQSKVPQPTDVFEKSGFLHCIIFKPINPLTQGPLCLLLSHGLQVDLPYKIGADLPKDHELRATVISPHPFSLRVSRLNNLFSNFIFWIAISIWNTNVITMEN